MYTFSAHDTKGQAVLFKAIYFYNSDISLKENQKPSFSLLIVYLNVYPTIYILIAKLSLGHTKTSRFNQKAIILREYKVTKLTP